MNIDKYIQNNLLKIKVTPNSKQTELKEENNQLKLYLKAVPEKDKANKELIRFFKKRFNLKVKVKSRGKSREKTLLLQNS